MRKLMMELLALGCVLSGDSIALNDGKVLAKELLQKAKDIYSQGVTDEKLDEIDEIIGKLRDGKVNNSHQIGSYPKDVDNWDRPAVLAKIMPEDVREFIMNSISFHLIEGKEEWTKELWQRADEVRETKGTKEREDKIREILREAQRKYPLR